MKNFIFSVMATFVAFSAWAQSPTNSYTYSVTNIGHNTADLNGATYNSGTDTLWYFAEASLSGAGTFVSVSDTMSAVGTLFDNVNGLLMSNLLPSTIYDARLRSYVRDTLGVITMDVVNDIETFQTLDAPQIGVINQLVFSQISETAATMNLSYACGNISTNFLVEWGTTNTSYTLGSMIVYGLQNSGDTLLTFNNLSAGNTYYFRVTPLNNSLGGGQPAFGNVTIFPYAAVAPTISSVNVDPLFGTPDQVQVVSGFDLGTSVSANLTVSVYEADGTLIGTSGPMVQTVSGIDTTTLAGFMYPGSVASYAKVSIVDPLTQVGDTATVDFISEPYVNATLAVSVDTVVNAPFGVMATVNVNVGDCAPLTVTPVLIQNGLPSQILPDSTFTTDGTWTFPILGLSSSVAHSLGVTGTGNCADVTEVAAFVSPEQNFLEILSVTTTAIGPDSLVSTATFDSGDLPAGIILASVLNSAGVTHQSFGGITYAGAGTRTIATGNLIPGATYFVRWVYSDPAGMVPNVVDVDTFVMPNVPVATGYFQGPLEYSDGAFSQSFFMNLNGSWAGSSAVFHYDLYNLAVSETTPTLQFVSGVMSSSGSHVISHTNLQAGGTYKLVLWFENDGGVDTVGTLNPITIPEATNPNVFLQDLAEVPGNQVRSQVFVEANGNQIELEYGLFRNGNLDESFSIMLGSSSDTTIVMTHGAYSNCDEVQIQVAGIVVGGLFNPAVPMNNLEEVIEINCNPLPNSVEENIWDGLVITTESITLPSSVEAEIQIVSMLGQVVLQKTFVGSLNFSLEPGAHIFRLVTDGHVTTRKIATL